MKVNERIKQIREVKNLRDQGHMLCIPYYKPFPRLSNFVPGIVKGIMYKVTAGSGVGKTQLTKALFVMAPLNYIRENPNSKFKLKIFYFALEENESEFIDSLICNQLAVKHKLHIDPQMLRGMRENYVDENTMKMIEDVEEDVQFFMDHIEVIDSVSNPTGMYKYCRTYSEKAGTHYWDDKVFTKKKADGTVESTTEKVYREYIPNDPNEHVIVIADHISLITEEYDKNTEKYLTKHQTMAKWSTHYCRGQMTKHWGWTVVNVQQQEQSSERQHYTNTGRSVVQKTEPTLDGLANNKEIQRDDYVIISLYSPDRFGFDEYNGYDIVRMRDTYRAIKILKNRLGVPNKYVSLLFDGATNRFKEIPFSDDSKMPMVYLESDKLLGRT